MAITQGTLTTKITESITLNGASYGGTVTDTVSGIGQIYKRIVSIPANGGSIDGADRVTMLTTTADATTTVGAGNFIVGDIKYCRITNLNSGAGEGVLVQMALDANSDDTDTANAWLLVEEGKSLIINTFAASFDAGVDIDAATLAGISDIRLVNEHASVVVDVEIFVASD